MRRLALIILTIVFFLSTASAARWPLGVPGPAGGNSGRQTQHGPGAVQAQNGLPPVQPWQPWQQWQQQIQQDMSPKISSAINASQQDNSTALKPSQQFVTLTQQERRPEFKQASQQLQQQQQSNVTEPFECGKPYMPCGAAIPEGKSCKQGAGWCQQGYFCGFEATTTEPSRCLPLPESCGKAGQPCCPSNADQPHTSLEEKLTRKPFCRDGSYCFYHAPDPELNNGDRYAGNKGKGRGKTRR